MRPPPQYSAPRYRGSGKLDGAVALITGGDSGIGRSVAVLFAREGADIAITHLPSELRDAEATADAIAIEGRTALLLAGDVTDPAFCDAAVGESVRVFGKLTVLVNNAAIQEHRPFDQLTIEDWNRTFDVNIGGYFRMVKAALPHLGRGASIINTGSVTGLEGSKELVDYAATKGAIHAFTKSLAQALADRGIRVNCVAPGPVWTPLNPAEREAGEIADFGADTPMGRPGQPEEIAPAFVYFASDVMSSYVSGEVLAILGGQTRAA